jgi:ornithine cyclodeaminase/alanine dehydrogenase-like protein (mu-crystallin family)
MTLLLTRGDVAALLTLDDCIAAVEEAFRVQGGGQALGPGVLAIHAPDGGLHIKAAGLALSRLYIAAKFNTNFPGNGARWGLPTIQGVVVLADGETGRPLALMDSMELTALRTGAATAVAGRCLARPEAAVATIVGCGRQGRIQLAALARVRRLERAWAVDLDPGAARRFADEMSTSLDLDVRPGELARVASQSDICVTCTPSRVPLLRRGDVRPGTFVAAVGSDNEHRGEIEPALMAATTIVVDSLEQCAAIGDLHHAIARDASPWRTCTRRSPT